MNFFRNSLACAALALLASSAQATVLFTVTELSDKTAVITASGTLEGPAPQYNQHWLTFDGIATGIGYMENAQVMTAGSNLSAGSVLFTGADTAGAAYQVSPTGKGAIYVYSMSPSWNANNLQAGSAVTGELDLNLATSSGMFAGTGTTGNVYWGSGSWGQVIGSYTIVSADAKVPEPASLGLLGGGLLAALAARRSRRRG